MELIFNKKEYFPLDEFFKGFPKEEFGISSKFEVGIIFKNSKNLESIVFNFIFDTSAFISYAPESILKRLNIKHKFEGSVYGIVSKVRKYS